MPEKSFETKKHPIFKVYVLTSITTTKKVKKKTKKLLKTYF